jgi:carbon storage regulator
MLILARKEGEEIIIGDTIRIVVVQVRSGGMVRLGIDAPKGISVNRLEVQRKVEADRLRNGHAH